MLFMCAFYNEHLAPCIMSPSKLTSTCHALLHQTSGVVHESPRPAFQQFPHRDDGQCRVLVVVVHEMHLLQTTRGHHVLTCKQNYGVQERLRADFDRAPEYPCCEHTEGQLYILSFTKNKFACNCFRHYGFKIVNRVNS